MTIARGMARLIPDRASRSLWWLCTGSLLALGLSSPFWGTLISIQITKRAYWPEVGRSLIANTIGVMAAMAILAVLLRRGAERATVARDVAAVTVAIVLGAVIRLVPVRLLGVGYQPMGRIAILTQLGFGLPALAITTVAIVYAGQRERAITRGYRETEAAQAALAREEEDVRGRIFDQLHGTLQAGLVDARRQLLAIADRLPAAEREAITQIEARLGELYVSEVAGLAGTLYPAGLELGLVPALRQLAARFAGSIDIRVTIDSFTQVLDAPALGGLHREARFAAYRIVEESVVNAMRHAGAPWIEVDLQTIVSSQGAAIRILARNPCEEGIAVTPGHGLTRMRSRASGLGGAVAVRASQGIFTVEATLPVQRSGVEAS